MRPAWPRAASAGAFMRSAGMRCARTTSRISNSTMATARELLEEADALMRRNRAQEAAAAHADIPVLTEAVDGDDGALGEDSIGDFAGMDDPTPIVVPAAFAQQPIIRDTTIGGDFPELTEIVV